MQRSEVLGHIISVRGVLPDPDKIDQVKSFPIPRDVAQVRQFLGLASYYRQFVPKFVKMAAPLHACFIEEGKYI